MTLFNAGMSPCTLPHWVLNLATVNPYASHGVGGTDTYDLTFDVEYLQTAVHRFITMMIDVMQQMSVQDLDCTIVIWISDFRWQWWKTVADINQQWMSWLSGLGLFFSWRSFRGLFTALCWSCSCCPYFTGKLFLDQYVCIVHFCWHMLVYSASAYTYYYCLHLQRSSEHFH